MIMVPYKKLSVVAIVMVTLFFITGFLDLTEARSRSGGRSFSPSRSYSRPATQPRQNNQPVRSPGSGLSGSFTRGLVGGLVGGAIGSMLFGGMAHGMGTGGFGGSGIGLIEILLIGGIIYFLYRKFFRRPALSPTGDYNPTYARSSAGQISGPSGSPDVMDVPPDDPLVNGVRQIWDVDPDFNPDSFKDTAQDLFFKIQAGWTRRETSVLSAFVGDQLLNEYAGHFAEMKQKGHVNRLENIAVRKVDLIDAGVEGSEIFVTVHFLANLLDYTVDDVSGNTISGDPQNPVKFEENWTFARQIGSNSWKLEGIE
jgi:predicted lipid-binding transport protein (Tim44 family)